MSMPVRVQLLGPVRALGDDGQLPLRGKSARTVLARLALSAPSVVSIDQLTDALWHDEPPLDPSLSLRSIISRLRAQLGGDAIVTDGPGYRIDPGLVKVDLAEVEALIRVGEPRDQDPDHLAATLQLWDGDALSDVAWTPAFEPERARIAELRAHLIDCFHHAMLASGRVAEALADLERDAAMAPLRESIQLLLMRALHACGRTPDALRAGDAYRNRLIDQTGLSPSADYDTLTHSLLTPDPQPSEPASTSTTAATEQAPTRPAAVTRTWIPPDTPFVGREAEIADLEVLAAGRRLVTIVGPGGVGKTRLVTEFMARDGAASGQSVNMVSLAALDQSSAVAAAVATVLGIEVSSDEPIEAIAARLAARPSTLVLDNCEHVLANVRVLVQQLLRDVEDLRIITTSRRRLGLPDEVLLAVGPLAVPNTNAIDSPPMHLFMDRVRRAANTLSVSTEDSEVAADICRLVDGLPLALELTAARVPMFGFDGLRQRLIDGLAVPGSRVADDDRRQATIESTVEWSLALLSPNARELFDDLSVFPSWFDLDALEQITQSQQVIDVFSEILDSSLVVVDHHRPAYRLLEPVRQVAARQIDRHRRDQTISRYITWMTSTIEAIDQCWIDTRFAQGQQLVIDHRADICWTLNHLIEQRQAETHGRFANVLAQPLTGRADIEIIDLCRVDVGPSLQGELARATLAWHQGDSEASAAMTADLLTRMKPGSPFWGLLHWIRACACLYLGDTTAVAQAASIAAADELAFPATRSEAVALWALALLYGGDQSGAAKVLADHEHILRRSGSGGFISYARAEVVAADNPQRAIDYLFEANADAVVAHATFNQRLTDVTRLILLIAAERSAEACGLALQLVPELVQTGTYPQAWTALRHVAALLQQLGKPELALLVLDSANEDPRAATVTGDSIEAELLLRTKLKAQGADRAAGPAPMSLAPVWDQVAIALNAALA